MLVSGILQHESAIGIHRSPPSWTSLPPPTPTYYPSRLSQSTGFGLSASNSEFPLTLLHMVMYMFQCYLLTHPTESSHVFLVCCDHMWSSRGLGNIANKWWSHYSSCQADCQDYCSLYFIKCWNHIGRAWNCAEFSSLARIYNGKLGLCFKKSLVGESRAGWDTQVQ